MIRQIIFASGLAAVASLSISAVCAQAVPLLQQNPPPVRVAKVDGSAVMRELKIDAEFGLPSSVACAAVPGSSGCGLLIGAQLSQQLQNEWVLTQQKNTTTDAEIPYPVSINLMLPAEAVMTAMVGGELPIRTAIVEEADDALVPVPEVPAVSENATALTQSRDVVSRHGRLILHTRLGNSGWRRFSFANQRGTVQRVNPRVFSEGDDYDVAVPPPAPAADIFDE